MATFQVEQILKYNQDPPFSSAKVIFHNTIHLIYLRPDSFQNLEMFDHDVRHKIRNWPVDLSWMFWITVRRKDLPKFG